MTNIKELQDRIDAATSLQQERQDRLVQEYAEAFERRRQRYHDLFVPALHRFNGVWLPRLAVLTDKFQTLARRFGEAVSVSPSVGPSPEEPHFGHTDLACSSSLAQVRSRFGFGHDVDIRQMVVDYELEIIPVMMKFERSAHLELKIDAFDEDALTRWLDDRIVNLIHTYLTIHDHAGYLADQMVEDPVAKVQIPKFAAAASLHENGKTFYFISPQTQQEFQLGRLA